MIPGSDDYVKSEDSEKTHIGWSVTMELWLNRNWLSLIPIPGIWDLK